MNPSNPQEVCSWQQETSHNPLPDLSSLDFSPLLGLFSNSDFYQPSLGQLAPDSIGVSLDDRPDNNESSPDSAVRPCISREEFELILKEYFKEPRERMMTEKERSNAIAVLQDPNNNSIGTPAYRYKIRREYELEETGENVPTLRYKTGKKVLVNEQIYDVLLKSHLDTGHGGQRITCDKAKEEYENVKQELGTLFVKGCNCSKANKNRDTARKRKYEGSEPPPAKNKHPQRSCVEEFLHSNRPQIENLKVRYYRDVLQELESMGDTLHNLLRWESKLTPLLSPNQIKEFKEKCYNIIALPIMMEEEEHDLICDCADFLSELNITNDGERTSEDIRPVIKEKLSAIKTEELQDAWDTINAEMRTMTDDFENIITEHWREAKGNDLNGFQERLRKSIFDI